MEDPRDSHTQMAEFHWRMEDFMNEKAKELWAPTSGSFPIPFNKEAKKAASDDTSPPHIMVELEGFTDADGTVVQGKEIKMLFSF